MKLNTKIFILVFFPVLIIYLFTAPQTVYWQDSGIYLAGIKTLGVMYPPGYPLYEILGFAWTKILSTIFGNLLPFAYYLHTLSAVFGTAASATIALAVYDLNQYLNKNNHKLNLAVSIIIGFATGISYSLWSQSINSEVYSLHALFVTLIIFLLVKLTINHNNAGIKNIYLLLFFYGLSFDNHPSTIFILPALVYFFIFIQIPRSFVKNNFSRIILAVLIFVLPIILLYLFLWHLSLGNPVYHWSRIRSLADLYNFVSGKQYLTNESSFNPFNLPRLISFPILLFQEFFFAIPLIIIGALHLIKQDNFIKHFTYTLLVLVSSIYFISFIYQQGGEYNYWLIPVYLVFMLFISVALSFLISKKNIYYLLILTLFVPQIFINLKLNNRGAYKLPQTFGRNILKNLPEHSILFVIGDQDSSITRYLQLVEGFRSDILILRPPDLQEKWLLNDFAKNFDLTLPDNYPDKITDQTQLDEYTNKFIKNNLDHHSIFLIQAKVINLSDDFKLVPAGTIWQVVKKDDPQILDLSFWQYDFKDPARYNFPMRSESPRKIKNNEGQTINIVRQKYSDEAKNFELQSYKNLIDYCANSLEGNKTIVVKTLDNKIEYWREKRLANCVLDEFNKILEVDPNFYNPDVWQSVSKAYNYLGDEEKSKAYYEEFFLKSTNQK
jgi:hypothetical protein